jgi:hypothetical protein
MFHALALPSTACVDVHESASQPALTVIGTLLVSCAPQMAATAW